MISVESYCISDSLELMDKRYSTNQDCRIMENLGIDQNYVMVSVDKELISQNKDSLN